MQHTDQKTAVVTGGGSGIGLAIAKTLSDMGFQTYVAGRRRNVLDAAAQQFGAVPMVMDVTDEASVTEAFAPLPRVDVLVANAGIAEGQMIKTGDFAFWRRIMATNLDGAWLTIREGLRKMPIDDWGRVIAISSIAGLRGLKGAHAYTASKHGLVGLIRALAADHVHKPVTFNAICPGYVDTDIITQNTDRLSQRMGIDAGQARQMMVDLNPHKRLIAPQEVAATVKWLCGPDAGSVDGQAIEVSGGPA